VRKDKVGVASSNSGGEKFIKRDHENLWAWLKDLGKDGTSSLKNIEKEKRVDSFTKNHSGG